MNGVHCSLVVTLSPWHSVMLRRSTFSHQYQKPASPSRGGCQHSLEGHIEAQLRGHDGALRVLSGNKPPVDHGIL